MSGDRDVFRGDIGGLLVSDIADRLLFAEAVVHRKESFLCEVFGLILRVLALNFTGI